MNENRYTTLHYSVDSQNQENPFLQTGEDYEHTKTLNFIRDRLVEVHGEPKNLDYMHKLNNAIMFVERMEDVKKNCGGIEPKVLRGAVEIKQEKPKRTKVELVKVELSPKEIFSEMLDGGVFFIDGDKIYFDGEQFWRGEGDDKSRITYISHVNDIYREVETEMTERDFIDGVFEKDCDHPCNESWFVFEGEKIRIDGNLTIKAMREITDNLDDNGKFKS